MSEIGDQKPVATERLVHSRCGCQGVAIGTSDFRILAAAPVGVDRMTRFS